MLIAGGKRLARICAPHGRTAATCLIILPLCLTGLDLAGATFLSGEYHLTKKSILKLWAFPHLAASAFVLLSGITIRTMMGFGLVVPRTFACLALFAAIARLSVSPDMDHELSHALFQSCDGYSDLILGAGILMLIAAGIVTMNSWLQHEVPSQASAVLRDAATP